MADVATREDVARVSALFTRGAMDAPDLRGDSMVTKHLEKIQQEKEKSAFARVQALHPTVGPTVCAIALEETAWEADSALELLTRFEAENKEKIAELLKAGNLCNTACAACDHVHDFEHSLRFPGCASYACMLVHGWFQLCRAALYPSMWKSPSFICYICCFIRRDAFCRKRAICSRQCQ